MSVESFRKFHGWVVNHWNEKSHDYYKICRYAIAKIKNRYLMSISTNEKSDWFQLSIISTNQKKVRMTVNFIIIISLSRCKYIQLLFLIVLYLGPFIHWWWFPADFFRSVLISISLWSNDTRSSRISTLLSDTSDGNKSRYVGEIVVAPDSNGNFRNNLARDNKLHIAHLCICSAWCVVSDARHAAAKCSPQARIPGQDPRPSTSMSNFRTSFYVCVYIYVYIHIRTYT